MELSPLHDHLSFLSPLSEQRADRLVSWLSGALDEGGTVLDVGCGWGELALRIAAAAPRARVVGTDLDEHRVREAGRRAAARGLGERAVFVAGDGATAGPAQVDALVAIGASQVWGADAGEGRPLDYRAALAGIRGRVRRGARVLYGEAVWTRSPTPAATAPLSGRDDEFVTVPDLVALVEEHGFAAIAVGQANLDEWDEFESGFTARYATWLAAHDPADADADEVQRRMTAQREGYLRGYRDVLGLAYLQLLAV